MFDLPPFTGPHPFKPLRIEEAHIRNARAVWAKLSVQWIADPHAEPDLRFESFDPSQAEDLIYHERTATERGIIDAAYVHQP